MNPTQLAALITELTTAAITAYKAIASTDKTLPPIETLLTQADANWQAIQAAAQKEIG